MKNKLINLVVLIAAVSYSVALRAQETPDAPVEEAVQEETQESLPGVADAAGVVQQEKETVTTDEKTNLVTDGVIDKKLIATREAIPYPKIREADIIWSKRVWRVIDLHERINLPLYYPTEELTLRQSLIQTLIRAVRDGEFRAYDPDEDDEFTTVLSAEDISKRFDAVDRTEKRQKMDGTGDTTVTIRGSYNWSQVLEILVKEDWFFDKHYSKLFVRIVGICPIRAYPKEMNTATETPTGGGDEENAEEEAAEIVKKQLFWLNYDEIRHVLARVPAYMPNNDATILSYDDIFNLRKFSSYITKESNPHNNRSISTYTATGYEALLESERIKSTIINWEHDLWEY